VTTFLEFDGGNTMSWPAHGEIVWEYSGSNLILDVTLNAFRVHDSVCISAETGTQVYAAAAGKVTEIMYSREKGRTVVIEHGNGWATTYGQLKSDVAVKVGDVVEQGQVIGFVGEPSIYSGELPPHVSFKVLRDDKAVDPGEVLIQR
jgi:murein DD-endopeptidase MepM/ murein hydrolase activator NlpD